MPRATSFNLSERARALAPPLLPTALRSVLPLLVAVAFAAFTQIFLRHWIGPFWSSVLLMIGVNIVLAVSLTMVNGFTGQFSMGHAGFLAVGGYVSGCIMYYAGLRGRGTADALGGTLSLMRPIRLDEGQTYAAWLSDVYHQAGLFTGMDGLFFVALCAGGLVAAVLGLLVGLPSLRLRGDYLAIVTLGFGEIVRVLIQQTSTAISSVEEARATPWYKLPLAVNGALGFDAVPKYSSLFWAFLAAGITLLVAHRVKNSTVGRAFLSIREDEIASEAMGVDTTRFKVWAFVLSAFFAGVAGGLLAHTIGVGISADSASFQKSFDIIIMVVLGGLGSISGATLAAIVVTVLPELLRGSEMFKDYRMILFALALILMMIFRPKGLLGTRELWNVGPWARFFARKGSGA